MPADEFVRNLHAYAIRKLFKDSQNCFPFFDITFKLFFIVTKKM